ncbi:conserved hypothetical protein [Sphingobium sp. SYK-6]|uniref:oxygenase MpaB family protein n=1 Tax=Sphingobium sp. (strain NBRC 103272 / SYK-6) TaxID=627192 RepID=UPI00022770E2|nr:oxygenase MpaB family protein [Sphingobium sp. SYK-6]BAK67515.1 conserved hypothetical protein [Sphingobium sp. SYK-6]
MRRPSQMVRGLLVRQIQDVFNDRERGEAPVVRSDEALFDRGSEIWRVHGDVTTMMIGGVTALLLQMLHPAALAGVWDHSSFRSDMLGRLRRTARFIAVTTFGERTQAEAAIARVRDVHAQISGVLDDGTAYRASDPRLLAWVHVCEAMAFLEAWRAFGEPGMTRTAQDRYFAQHARIARALGAAPVPESRAEAETLIESFRPELRVTARTRAVARMILDHPPPTLAMLPTQKLVMQAAVEIMPRWARKLHGFARPPFSGPLVRGSAFALAQTVRWAFRPESARPTGSGGARVQPGSSMR